jgi:hypothetical protein
VLYPTEEKQKAFVDFLVNGDEDDEDEFISDEEDFVEKNMHYELQSVMRIKMKFFKWFEEFFKTTMGLLIGIGS